MSLCLHNVYLGMQKSNPTMITQVAVLINLSNDTGSKNTVN